MNINTRKRNIFYSIILLGLSFLLFREYTYVHPYNPGMGWFGPRWTYISTKTITWWFLLFSTLILTTPLFRKQKIGFYGLALLITVVIRPIIQNKFPEETVFEFYSERKKNLKSIVQETDVKNQTISNQRIEKLGFGKLIVQDSIYYFFCVDEEFPFGICYTSKENLPNENLTFGRHLKFQEIDNHWYELDE